MIPPMPRPPVDHRDLLRRVLVVWAVIVVLALAANIPAIAQLRFPDPDDTLRLVQVRDLLGGQGWFDLHQHRIDPLDGGVPMHWSRLVDIPIAAIILLLRPLLGQGQAELAALVIVPMLTMLCALLLVARVAWARLGAEPATLACFALAIAVPVVTQIRPMRIDHHGWQVAAALAALQGLMTRHARGGGWLSGLALAIGLSISLEGLPLTLVFAAIAFLRWVRGERQWLAAMLQGLAAGSVACFMATRGLADVAQHCDAISPFHLGIFAFAALATTTLAARGRLPLVLTLALFGAMAAGALAIVLAAAPQCTAGTFNELDPVVRRLWFDGVAEGLPIWKQDLATGLQIAVPCLIALWTGLSLYLRTAGEEREWWGEYTLLLAGAFAIACLVARAGAAATALAVIALSWQLSQWLRLARNPRGGVARAGAVLAVALALLPSLPVTVLGWAVPARAVGPVLAPAAASQHVYSCEIRAGGARLSGLARGNILAPLDIGPELLMTTPDTVLATGHHRGARAMREVIDAFTGTEDAAHAIIRRRQIAYLALCPDLGEPGIYRKAAPQGFAAQLLDGKVPGWLAPVADRRDGHMLIWKVVG